MNSTSNVEENVQRASYFIAQAAQKGARLAVLPENFAHLGLTPDQTLKIAEEDGQGFIQAALKKVAKQNHIWVVGGTIPIKSPVKNKVFSSCLVWDNQGNCVKRYDKIHLFDVIVAEKEPYRESLLITPGNEIQVVNSTVGKIGLAICYDLRFPELFRKLMLQGAQILVLPSAFTVPTGKAHWETLIRARAIENLCYVIASAEVGSRANGTKTYGHSMIVDPWGEIIASLPEGEGFITATIDLKKLNDIRQQFPALTHIKIQEGNS